MQAVILAAGKSERCYPLTITRPKPLLKIANKTILEHNLEQLEGIASQAIIVVGYKKEMITSVFGSSYNGIRLSYVEQEQQAGTANALMKAEEMVGDRFFLLNGDDIYCNHDLDSCLDSNYAVLCQERQDIKKFGMVTSKEGCLEKIVEKPASPGGDKLANTGLYLLDKSIFQLIRQLKKSERGEYELTDVVNELARTEKISAVNAKQWLPNSYPWDLLASNEFLLNKLNHSEIRGEVEAGVTIKDYVKVGKGTLIRSGTYIEGPVVIGENCKIGPNCYIRGSTSIGNNCHIGQAVELKNSIVMDSTNVPHLNYVGDSVIGEKSNLGAGTTVANLRHDNGNVKSAVKGELVDTGRRKLGAIVGDNVHTGINTSIYPGRKIWPNKTTRPGEIVDKDIC